MVGVRRHVGGSWPGDCGGVKTPPYGMSHKRDMVVSGGPGMPGPYGVAWRGEDERGEEGRQPSPFPVDGWPR